MATISVNIPSSELPFFRKLMGKMGWKITSGETALKRYLDSRPKNVNLTDEEILSELNAVRYKK